MSNELIVFTHNDLDALGCMLNLEFKFPGVPKKFFHTNYNNINQITEEILDYQKKTGATHLVMPDVSFSDNKAALIKLYHAFEKCTHIDHHLYPDDFWDDFPNMTVVYDKNKSATLLCHEYLGNGTKNANLDKLTNLIDVYDIWQTKHPYFNVSQDLNEYFWKFGIEWLFNEIVKADYAMPANFGPMVQQIRKEYTEKLKEYEERKLIHRQGEITFAFVYEHFNRVLLKEMAEGQNFVIGMTSFGIVKIRIREEAPYTDEQKKALRKALTGNDNIGHMNAFTYKIGENLNFDVVMEEAKKIANLLQRIMK